MTLYFIGLGLYDEKDITVRGLEIIRNSKQVFLEAYTSILMVDVERLEKFYGRKVQVADREMVESFSDKILDASRSSDGDVCFLVVGDPFAATTHSDLYLRARAMGIPTQIIHNASILNAVGSCGLSLYKYGQTVSLVFFTETWQPDSFYDRIKQNRAMGLHTLVLLDIKVKEQSIENLVKNRKIYEPPRYMSVPRAASQLLAIEEKRQENVYNENTVAVAVARAGAMESQAIIVAKLADFAKAEPFEKHENEDEDEDEFDDDTNENVKIDNLKIDNHHQQMHMLKSLGGPLHSLIIPSKDVHEMELEMLKLFILSPEYESGILASINKH